MFPSSRRSSQRILFVRESIVENMYVIVGAAIIAIGFNVFLLPNQVYTVYLVGIEALDNMHLIIHYL